MVLSLTITSLVSRVSLLTVEKILSCFYKVLVVSRFLSLIIVSLFGIESLTSHNREIIKKCLSFTITIPFGIESLTAEKISSSSEVLVVSRVLGSFNIASLFDIESLTAENISSYF